MIHTLITDEVKRQIIRTVEDKIPENDQVRFAICERQAALAIIRYCLGEDYFKREFRLDADFEKFPASEYVSHSTAENLIKVKTLAQCVEDLYECMGFEHKRKELRGTRFDSVAFELLIASYFRELGCELVFPGPKGCDFILENSVQAECKFMENWTSNEKEIASRFVNYLEETTARIRDHSQGILVVGFPIDHFPTVDERASIRWALQLAFEMVSNSQPRFINRVLGVRVLAEITTSIGPSRLMRSFRRILAYQSRDYLALPKPVRKALEDDQDRLKPRTWVNYKGIESIRTPRLKGGESPESVV